MEGVYGLFDTFDEFDNDAFDYEDTELGDLRVYYRLIGEPRNGEDAWDSSNKEDLINDPD
jgi:hypothetical protein